MVENSLWYNTICTEVELSFVLTQLIPDVFIICSFFYMKL